MTLLLQFIMVLASDTENANYFCQYINLGGFLGGFCFQFTKQILSLLRTRYWLGTFQTIRIVYIYYNSLNKTVVCFNFITLEDCFLTLMGNVQVGDVLCSEPQTLHYK